MKSILLSFMLYCGLMANPERTTPFIGKWHNVSKNAAIKEIVFYPDNNVRFSNGTYAFNQYYSLSPDKKDADHSFKGFFRIVNVGKLLKESKVAIMMLKQDLMEIKIDEEVIVLKKD